MMSSLAGKPAQNLVHFRYTNIRYRLKFLIISENPFTG